MKSHRSIDDALCMACGAGDIGGIEFLLGRGADVNYNRGEPFVTAVRAGKSNVLEYLLKREGQKLLDSALTWAVRTENDEMVNDLINGGADVNGDDGMPIFEAIQKQNKLLIQLLLDKGANLTEEDRQSLREQNLPMEAAKSTAVKEPARRVRQESMEGKLELSVDKKIMAEKLYRAVANNDTIGLQRLLESGVDPDVKEERYQSTALHAAVFCRHTEAVKLLLESSANVNIPNLQGQTPISISKMDMASNPESEKVLGIYRMLSSKQKLPQESMEGKSELPVDKEIMAEKLYRAAASNNTIELRRLLNSKIDPNVRERRYQSTALHAAVFCRDTEAVKLLLDFNADVNIPNPRGQTPISINQEDMKNNPKSEKVSAIQELLMTRGANSLSLGTGKA